MAEDGALTSAELAERLQISPASVSGAVRYLASQQLIRRTYGPDSRRELYRVDRDVFYHSTVGRNYLLQQWRQILLEGVDVLGVNSEAGQRLQLSADFVEFLDRELHDLVDRWDAHVAQRDGSDRSG